MYNIEWKGDKVKNYYTNRSGEKPRAICNHISAGTMGSMYNWFTSPDNTQSSAHFGVGRNGEIHQYVSIENGSWTQGLAKGSIQYATAPIVHDLNIDPNYYCVSIEHEGYIDDSGEKFGIDGDLTEEQFYATCWLHKWIQTEVLNRWNIHILLGRYNVIGHYQVAPKTKPNCPGPKFPWERLYSELAIAEKMTLKEYEERLSFLKSNYNNRAFATKTRSRIADLYNKAQGEGPWKDLAIEKLSQIGRYMVENDLMDP